MKIWQNQAQCLVLLSLAGTAGLGIKEQILQIRVRIVGFSHGVPS